LVFPPELLDPGSRHSGTTGSWDWFGSLTRK
jgi:hypothetical protein